MIRMFHSVIPAVRNLENIKDAVDSPSKVVFLLTGSIMNLEEAVYVLKKHNKEVFIHIDLIKGLSHDKAALEYIVEIVNAEGIISTHIPVLKTAKEMGLRIVQRIFLIDSAALENGIYYAKDLKPDLLEILPGIIPEFIEEISKKFPEKVIAGGLIKKREQVLAALKAGAKAVSTSCVELWKNT